MKVKKKNMWQVLVKTRFMDEVGSQASVPEPRSSEN